MATIDDFEDGDLSEYGGDMGQFDTVTSPVHEGSYALEGVSDGSNYIITSTSSLPNYFGTGQQATWRMRIRSASSDKVGFVFNADSEGGFGDVTGYVARKDANADFWEIAHVTTSGISAEVQSDPGVYPENEWLKGKVLWENNRIEFHVDREDGTNIVELVFDSPSDIGGAVGWYASAAGSATVGMDDARVFDFEPPTIEASGGESVDLSWDAVPGDWDEYRIYRDTSSGVSTSGDPIATTSGTSYTDTDVVSDTTYYYRVTTGFGGSESADSNEESASTYVPEEPTNFTATVVDSDTVDLSWTDNATDEDGYRVYRDTGSGAEVIADLPADTESYTDGEALDGRQQTYHVEAYTTDAASSSSTDTVTTPLPQVEGFVIDASVQAELTVDPNPILDNGEFRIRWKRAEDTSYPTGNEATLAHDAEPLEYTITGLLDGEKYDIGVRTETVDATGDWHTAAEITKLVPADEITATNVTETGLDLSWTVNNDFDGSQRIFRDRPGYTFDDDRGELIATVASDTTSYTENDTLVPSTEYTYTIVATTQYVSADSDPFTVETADAGLAQYAAPPRGWYVEVDHPSGNVLTPQVLDDIEKRPRLNEQSRVDIPVPRNETWLSSDLDDATIRVWKDGVRLPIDTLDDREIEPDRVMLHATGGRQLERRIREDVEVQPAHELVEDLVTTHTDYVANVDAPEVEESEDVMQDVSSGADWESVTESINLDTVPADIQNDRLVVQDACDPRDALNQNDGESLSFRNNDAFNNGQAAELVSSGQYVEFDITWPYRLSADDVGLIIRDEVQDSSNIDYYWDGVKIDDNTASGKNLSWQEVGSLYSGNYDGYDEVGEDLEPGVTHTFRVEAIENSAYILDCIAVYDQRYNFTFPNPGASENGGGYLSGPETKPHAVTLRLDPAETILAVIAGSLDSSWDNISNNQAVAITNTDSSALVEAANSETVSNDWADPGDRIQAELTLSRYGERTNAFPTQGFEGQTVDSYTLSATLDDTPMIIDQTFDDDLVAALDEIAQDANAIFEVDRDDTTGDISIEWCQPGQRSADVDLDVVDYTTTRIVPNIQRAIVYGGAQPVRDEAFVADIGNAVGLEEGDLVPGTAFVRDDSGTRYRRGDDYELDRQAGTITALSDGDMVDGTEYTIDYEWKVRGEFESGFYSGDSREEHIETIAQLTTERACGQAAKLIVDSGIDPRHEADVNLPPTIPAELSLVEALDLEDVPGDAMAIYSLQETPAGLRLRLGSRDRVRDTVSQIERRVEATSRRV